MKKIFLSCLSVVLLAGCAEFPTPEKFDPSGVYAVKQINYKSVSSALVFTISKTGDNEVRIVQSGNLDTNDDVSGVYKTYLDKADPIIRSETRGLLIYKDRINIRTSSGDVIAVK